LHTTRERKRIQVKFYFSIGRMTQLKVRRYKRRFRKYYIVVRATRKGAGKEKRRFSYRRRERKISRERMNIMENTRGARYRRRRVEAAEADVAHWRADCACV
jgi:hypothetical protein